MLIELKVSRGAIENGKLVINSPGDVIDVDPAYANRLISKQRAVVVGTPEPPPARKGRRKPKQKVTTK